MSDSIDSLILDLLEWIASRPRSYPEAMDAWRTSCPHLPVWEEASSRGYIDQQRNGAGVLVSLTASGAMYLRQHRSRPSA